MEPTASPAPAVPTLAVLASTPAAPTCATAVPAFPVAATPTCGAFPAKMVDESMPVATALEICIKHDSAMDPAFTSGEPSPISNESLSAEDEDASNALGAWKKHVWTP